MAAPQRDPYPQVTALLANLRNKQPTLKELSSEPTWEELAQAYGTFTNRLFQEREQFIRAVELLAQPPTTVRVLAFALGAVTVFGGLAVGALLILLLVHR